MKREQKIALPACHVGPEDCRSHVDGCKVTLDKEKEKNTDYEKSRKEKKGFRWPRATGLSHTLMMQFVIKGV
jgi:hypothetical protein